MTVSVQNMVCARCELVIRERLAASGLPSATVNLGQIDFERDLTEEELTGLDAILEPLGFERLRDKRTIQIDRVRALALEWVKGVQMTSPYTFSSWVAERMGLDYTYISHLFSSETGHTLEQYLISLRVELAKDLLLATHLSLQEISERLGYSSPAHFSNQFKKLTGLAPSEFRQKPGVRLPLDKL